MRKRKRRKKTTKEEQKERMEGLIKRWDRTEEDEFSWEQAHQREQIP